MFVSLFFSMFFCVFVFVSWNFVVVLLNVLDRWLLVVCSVFVMIWSFFVLRVVWLVVVVGMDVFELGGCSMNDGFVNSVVGGSDVDSVVGGVDVFNDDDGVGVWVVDGVVEFVVFDGFGSDVLSDGDGCVDGDGGVVDGGGFVDSVGVGFCSMNGIFGLSCVLICVLVLLYCCVSVWLYVMMNLLCVRLVFCFVCVSVLDVVVRLVLMVGCGFSECGFVIC